MSIECSICQELLLRSNEELEELAVFLLSRKDEPWIQELIKTLRRQVYYDYDHRESYDVDSDDFTEDEDENEDHQQHSNFSNISGFRRAGNKVNSITDYDYIF